YRGISYRVEQLVENTRRMAAHLPLLSPLRGVDEISQLDRAFHSMAGNLLRTRATVEEKMNLLQSILDNMSEGVMMVDHHGDFLLHNPAAEQMLGVGAKDVAPNDWSRKYGLFLPDQVTPYPDRDLPLPRTLRNESVQSEEIYVRSDFNPQGRWISVTARPLRDAAGKVWGGTAVFRDATQRKRAEAELRASAAEIRDLYNNAPCGYHSLDVTGTFVAMNDTELRWLGYTREEVLGKMRFPDLITVDSRGRFEDIFPQFKRDGWIGNLEYSMVRKDGSTFPVVVTASAIRDAEGVYVSSRSIVLDISERKDAEEEIRRLNADLERRIEERTTELSETNRELHQKNKENEMFVYSVSHDLRSPLVNLQGFGQELGLSCADLRALLLGDEVPVGVRDRGVALLNGPMAKSLRYVQSGVLRLSNIIDGMLRLSRTGRVIYRWQKVDVGATVVRIVDALRGTAEQRGAVVTINPLKFAWGDPTALEQVFANLITNSINYLDPQRPGQIEIGCLEAGTESLDGQRTYYVRDNGLGIATAYHPKVFQAFQRLHPEMAAGEGIGLTIVQRIVERHRGKVWFESTVGQGCTFFVTLPTEPGSDE
ncbi:MAG: tmoS 2, partial [Planctomycetaceae bacterium]|nr:tmoS 2 [Planctomycetaceae bacterium]